LIFYDNLNQLAQNRIDSRILLAISYIPVLVPTNTVYPRTVLEFISAM